MYYQILSLNVKFIIYYIFLNVCLEDKTAQRNTTITYQ